MKVSILQSNYIPWKGYFDIIKRSDIFVFLDDVQYTTGDWRNRNLIKTKDGVQWLTIPVGDNIHRKINEVSIDTWDWQKDHYNKIYYAYRKAPYFKLFNDWLEEIYLDGIWGNLSILNQGLIKSVTGLLGYKTKFMNSTEIKCEGKKQDKLISTLKTLGADCYLSGPAGKNYINENDFTKSGIKIEWMEYNYPEYPQLHGKFVHEVSIIDMIMNLGYNINKYI